MALRTKAKPAADGSTFQSHQRPKSLLSMLIRCGCCGGGVSKISETHVGWSNARNKGEAACTNRRTVKLVDLEGRVLDALRTRLMELDIYAAFVRRFTAQWNAEQKGRAVEQEGKRDELKRDELKRVDRKIANLVYAAAEDGSSVALRDRLKDAEARKAAEGGLVIAAAPAPRLMPTLADLYRQRVAAYKRLWPARTRRPSERRSAVSSTRSG